MWGTIGAAAIAVIVYQLVHHPAAPGGPHTGARPAITVTVTAPPVPAVTLPPGPGSGSPVAGAGGRAVAAASSATVHASPTAPGALPPSTPAPRPTPGPHPVVEVSAAVVVPLRGATPLAARAVVVVPGAPPFPRLLDLALTLP